jgi:hypothetical protein
MCVSIGGGPVPAANLTNCHPVNPGGTTALVGGNVAPGAAQIAAIDYPIPQFPIATRGIIPAPLIKLVLNAEEPSLIASSIRVHGCFLRPHCLSVPCLPSPCTRLSRAPTITQAPPLDAVFPGLHG